LCDLLKLYVSKVVVCDPRRKALLNAGNKSDRINARKLADLLRNGSLVAVYHGETGLLTREAMIDSFVRTPVDTEVSLPTMTGGDLLVGSFVNNQIGYNRPFQGAGEYRAPMPNFYLCGGSSHPGGNVTGPCGYNAAPVLASDLSLPIWWNLPQLSIERV